MAVRARRGEGGNADHVLLEVIDSGIGVDPDRLELMFQPFVQADVSTTREYGGNGLGLAIAKELVELMGGTIGASSEPGRGSTFWFDLSLPEVATTQTASSPRDERVVQLSERRSDPNAALVLVVEDSPVNRLVAVHVLERLGFRAHVVNDGREALQALSTQRYDAVLMDCQMPDIDGYEATRELRRRESGEPPHAGYRDDRARDDRRPRAMPGRRHGRLHRQARSLADAQRGAAAAGSTPRRKCQAYLRARARERRGIGQTSEKLRKAHQAPGICR